MLKLISLAVILSIGGCSANTLNRRGLQGEKGEPGTNGTLGLDGKDGKDGKDGAKGEPGLTGESCTVAKIEGAAKSKLSCSNGSVFVLDGSAGQNGASCQVAGFDDYPNLKAIRCDKEYLTLVNDGSFFGYCIDASASTEVKKTVDSMLIGFQPNEDRAKLCQQAAQSLDAEPTYFAKIPEGADLAPVKALKNLRGLQIETLSVIKSNSLTGFSNLENLFIRFKTQKASVIEADAFAGLSKLKTLHLSYSGDLSFVSNAFRGLDNLEELSVVNIDSESQKPFGTIYRGAFSGLSKLATLRMPFLKIQAIESGAFAGLTSLRYINIVEHQLQILEPGTFAGLTALEKLYLSYGPLKTLPEGIFADLTSLSNLKLSNNKLTTIPAKLFENLNVLKSLDLNSNEISSVDDQGFVGLGKLESLFFGSNPLRTKTKAFEALPGTCTIDFL